MQEENYHLLAQIRSAEFSLFRSYSNSKKELYILNLHCY